MVFTPVGVPGEGAGVAVAPDTTGWQGEKQAADRKQQVQMVRKDLVWSWTTAEFTCVGREDTVLKAEWASFHGVLISCCVFCFPAFFQFLLLVLLSNTCAADFFL